MGSAIEQYKLKVAQVARDYAIRYNWCKEVKSALAELDVPLADPVYQVRVRVDYEFDMLVDYDALASIAARGTPYIGEHLHVPELMLVAKDDQLSVVGNADPVLVQILDYTLKEAELDPDA